MKSTSVKHRRMRTGALFHQRRGAVAVQVAVSLTMILGFAALVIDVGAIYNMRADLQRTADSAALAAAAELGMGANDPKTAAKSIAQEFAAKNLAMNETIALDEATDIEFGRGYINEDTNRYIFEPDPMEEFPNAIKVTARKTDSSSNGSFGLFFARVLGFNNVDVSASATAVLIPRDIVIVTDLSGSHTDDSELSNMYKTDINIYDVWTALPNENITDPQTDSLGFTSSLNIVDNGDGTSTLQVTVTSDDNNKTAALSHITFGIPEGAWPEAINSALVNGETGQIELGVDPTTGVGGIKFEGSGTEGLGEDGEVMTAVFSFTISNEYLSEMVVATKAGKKMDTSVTFNFAPGPTFGRMNDWGTQQLGYGYNPNDDGGLYYLPYNQNWSDSTLSNWLYAQGYSYSEVNALMRRDYDSSGAWQSRVAVALGLARWSSGHPGGLWESTGDAPGNGNNWVGWGSELVWLEEWPNPGGSWEKYINYVKNNYIVSTQYTNLRYRFGLKTLVNYYLNQEPDCFSTPALADCPVQPMQAVKDAANELITIISGLDSNDRVGMVGYGQVGYGPQDFPNNLSWLTEDWNGLHDRLDLLQGGMWTSYTNISQGIDQGVNVLLNSPNSRPGAAKVMILLTDGLANYVREDPSYYNTGTARDDTRTAAQDARDMGIRIYTVSVGSGADTSLMDEVAAIGDGEWFHAEGEIAEYESQLKEIFQNLGGKRPVVLIE